MLPAPPIPPTPPTPLAQRLPPALRHRHRRWRRLALLLLAATLAGLITDALRPDRVLFPKKTLPPLEFVSPEP
ncbi:MAG: hypothetical protein LBM04_11920 [Opitutaceae bacterium]|jgi:hypothetical protein|nr:hypothetical protein [Opitutaceae bacterium]